jgi:hypothetical protein
MSAPFALTSHLTHILKSGFLAKLHNNDLGAQTSLADHKRTTAHTQDRRHHILRTHLWDMIKALTFPFLALMPPQR